MSKTTTTAIIGASLAALAAGTYVSYNKGTWPFRSKPGGNEAANEKGGHSKSAPGNGATAPVDVALTNEVASYTEHNPNNAGNFTDDGATGNAD